MVTSGGLLRAGFSLPPLSPRLDHVLGLLLPDPVSTFGAYGTRPPPCPGLLLAFGKPRPVLALRVVSDVPGWCINDLRSTHLVGPHRT